MKELRVLGRPPKVDKELVIAEVLSGRLQIDVAREMGVSRVRVCQIMAEYEGRDIYSTGVDDLKTASPRLRQMILDTLKALKDSVGLADAACTLGLTTSGLQSRIRRHPVLTAYMKPQPVQE